MICPLKRRPLYIPKIRWGIKKWTFGWKIRVKMHTQNRVWFKQNSALNSPHPPENCPSKQRSQRWAHFSKKIRFCKRRQLRGKFGGKRDSEGNLIECLVLRFRKTAVTTRMTKLPMGIPNRPFVLQSATKESLNETRKMRANWAQSLTIVHHQLTIKAVKLFKLKKNWFSLGGCLP